MGRTRKTTGRTDIADNEIRLVSKIIRDKDIKPALERGINASWFVNPQAKIIWETILEHWTKYSMTPTVQTIKDVLPGVTIYNVEESTDYLLDAFCEWRAQGLTVEMMQRASVLIEQGDFDEARQLLQAQLVSIEDSSNTTVSHDIDLTQTTAERIEAYLSLANLPGGLRGLPTGFPTIDKATLGLQPQQLVTVVATPKVGKSTLAEAIALNVFRSGFSPMLVSYEMSNEEQARRIDAMATNLAHSSFMTGDFSPQQQSRLRARLEVMSQAPHPFHLVADPSGTSTISGLNAKAEQKTPDVMILDGVYLMMDEVTGEHNTPAALTNITRALKRMAQKRDIPIVIMTQALTWKLGRGKKITGDSIGYSSSFFQDSDVLLGLQYVDEDDDDNTDRLLRVVASRNCARTQAELRWDWTTSTFEEYGMNDD